MRHAAEVFRNGRLPGTAASTSCRTDSSGLAFELGKKERSGRETAFLLPDRQTPTL
jgi:hypothetical protein